MTDAALLARAQNRCELCGATDDLAARVVPPDTTPVADRAVLACATCRAQLDGGTLDEARWHGLREAIWSEVPAVQVVAWRVLRRLDAAWARDLLDQVWLDEPVLAWAQAVEDEVPEAPADTVDANGARLADGDTVTLIKDLDVKGGGFTAKRGTVVKGIRLTDDPGLIEGRVEGTAIYLKTEFLKKA